MRDSTPAFDLSDQYAEMLRRGISLSGEDQQYFIAGRIRDLQSRLPRNWKPARILDFGCGFGDSAQYLSEIFPSAEVVGVDTAAGAIARARTTFGSPRLTFGDLDLLEEEHFDLCYTNGVFHHIPPGQRASILRQIRDSLVPGGYFALYENNPWNPGTRLVMSRIPFDRDAQPISPPEARRLIFEAGFRVRSQFRSLFYFPRPLAFLRFTEPVLARFPLGAQYGLLTTR